jgi:hypothetical protein
MMIEDSRPGGNEAASHRKHMKELTSILLKSTEPVESPEVARQGGDV